jgi:hypothetical protein
VATTYLRRNRLLLLLLLLLLRRRIRRSARRVPVQQMQQWRSTLPLTSRALLHRSCLVITMTVTTSTMARLAAGLATMTVRTGRFGITNAMDQLRRENGVNGFVVNGERFDLGTPLHFLETSKNFSTRT